MKADEVRVRGVAEDDRERLATFLCSNGDTWEDVVQEQIQGPLPKRYLSTPSYFDGHLLLGLDLRTN